MVSNQLRSIMGRADGLRAFISTDADGERTSIAALNAKHKFLQQSKVINAKVLL